MNHDICVTYMIFYEKKFLFFMIGHLFLWASLRVVTFHTPPQSVFNLFFTPGERLQASHVDKLTKSI